MMSRRRTAERMPQPEGSPGRDPLRRETSVILKEAECSARAAGEGDLGVAVVDQ